MTTPQVGLNKPQHSPLAEVRPVDSQSIYTGGELESMQFASNYHKWILDVFRPYLGKRIVEVGAGAGSFSEMLLGTEPEWLISLEPSTNMYPLLAERLRAAGPNHAGRAHQGTLLESVESIRKTGSPDSVVYINVLEHVEDDVRELKTIHSLLQPGGRVLIFVPAHSWLMGSMDRQLGHFRRYELPDLVDKCRAAGFTIPFCSYFDMLGIAPWWVKYCVLRSQTMEPAAVRLYDRYGVRFSRFLDGLIRPPVGKNVILVAEKGKL
jgi:SAM-dependent methyltransferase